MTKRIGFIGVGLMGHGMCKNLLEKGYAVIGLAHRNRTPLEDLIEKGLGQIQTYMRLPVTLSTARMQSGFTT